MTRPSTQTRRKAGFFCSEKSSYSDFQSFFAPHTLISAGRYPAKLISSAYSRPFSSRVGPQRADLSLPSLIPRLVPTWAKSHIFPYTRATALRCLFFKHCRFLRLWITSGDCQLNRRAKARAPRAKLTEQILLGRGPSPAQRAARPPSPARPPRPEARG